MRNSSRYFQEGKWAFSENGVLLSPCLHRSAQAGRFPLSLKSFSETSYACISTFLLQIVNIMLTVLFQKKLLFVLVSPG